MMMVSDRREWFAAVGWAVGLSVYFFVVYGVCAAATARRGDVGLAGFAWEVRWVPFVPAMIVPYMSIDLFFFGAPFLCRNRQERIGHAKRVGLAVAIAGACFLLFPLTTRFVRPVVGGVWGPVFRFLYGFDRPYNLAPSLHIALRTLLWVVYVRRTRGLVRAGLKIWFVLIGVSTLVTYQHHLVDVASGQLLGLMCLHVAPVEAGARARNWKAAFGYGAGAAALFVLGYLLRPWGLLLWWPGVSLGVMAVAYGGVGSAVFRKRDGRLAATTYIVLGPWLVGAWLWMRWRTRSEEEFVEVKEGLWMGRAVWRRGAERLRRAGVKAVVDLTAEFSETAILREMRYINTAVMDLTTPGDGEVREAVSFIGREHEKGGVYVHCAWGYSRSATVIAAYLLTTGEARTAEEALDRIRAKGRRVVVSGGSKRFLRVLSRTA